MEEIRKSKLSIFDPQNWSWILDAIIACGSLLLIIYFVGLAIIDFKSFERWDSLLSVFLFLYSIFSAISKFRHEKISKKNFQDNVEPLFESCRNILEIHIPRANSKFGFIEDRIINTFLNDWIKYQDLSSIDYQIIETYINYLSNELAIEDGDKIFLHYVLITSSFPYQYSRFVQSIRHGDYFSESSPFNRFIKILFEFIEKGLPFYKISIPSISDEQIEETMNFALKTDSSVIHDLLQERKNKQKIDFLLNKAFENAYSFIGEINIGKKNDKAQKIVFIYKYDERFSIYKRKLHTEIKKYYEKQGKVGTELEKLITSTNNVLNGFLTPYPLSKALADFPYCIEKLARRDNFLFVIHPEEFRIGAIG